VEAGLILVAGASLIFGSVPRLLGGVVVHDLRWGVVLMAGSALVNWFVSNRLLAAGKRLDSPAVSADGHHLRTDVFTSAGVLTGLLLILLTGYTAFDPIMALAVSGLILKVVYDLGRESLQGFLDVHLPMEEEGIILDVLAAYTGYFINYHALRTRRSGSRRLVDLHLMVPKDRPIVQVHDLCDHIEQELVGRLPGGVPTRRVGRALIHIEPCKRDCPNCRLAGQVTVEMQLTYWSSWCRYCLGNAGAGHDAGRTVVAS